MKNLETYISNYGEDYGKRIENATNQIKEGGFFNGTVYAKKVSTQNRDVSVYVDGNLHPLGRFHHSEVEDFKKLFFSLLKEDGRKEEEDELANTGLGYYVRKSELARANELGFDGIESDNYY